MLYKYILYSLFIWETQIFLTIFLSKAFPLTEQLGPKDENIEESTIWYDILR